MKAVIQAGGKGTRLRPYTLVLPKPLMPVGDLPVIEMLIKWLRRYGIREIYITTGYLGHLPAHFVATVANGIVKSLTVKKLNHLELLVL